MKKSATAEPIQQEALEPITPAPVLPEEMEDDIPEATAEVQETKAALTERTARILPMIYASVVGAMGDITHVGKGQVSKDWSGKAAYNYRGIDDVMNALHPAMVRNGIFIVPEVIKNERSVVNVGAKQTAMNSVVLTIKYTLYAQDGSHIETVVVGEAFDSGDKATSKAMSIALKYALFQVFCIPTEEMRQSDPDAVVNEPISQPKPAEPQKAETLREKVARATQPAQAAKPVPQEAPKTVNIPTPAEKPFSAENIIKETAIKLGFSDLSNKEQRMAFMELVHHVQTEGKCSSTKIGEMSERELRVCMDALLALNGAA